MKTCLTFLLFLLPSCLYAQMGRAVNKKTSKYYTSGMASSVYTYDSALSSITWLRYQKKTEESVFLQEYNSMVNQYRKQQQRIADIALKWATLPDSSRSKNIKYALGMLDKKKMTDAAAYMEQKLKPFSVQENNKKELRLLSEMYTVQGLYSKAIFLSELVTASTFAIADDFSYLADLYSIAGKDSLAVFWNQKVTCLSETDTAAFMAAALQLGKIYGEADHLSAALPVLIQVSTLQAYSKKRDTEHQLLSAASLLLQARLHLSVNNFAPSLQNASDASVIYRQIPDEAGLAASWHTLALIYKTAGANNEADTFYGKSLGLYEKLAAQYPEKYLPLLLRVMDEYADVLRWFDRLDELDRLFRKTIALRKGLVGNINYPFFVFDYALNLDALAKKLMDVNLNIFLAEEQWLKAKDTLELLYKKHPMLCGEELCGVLYLLGGVKIALKQDDEAIPFFTQSLTVREYLYRLEPSKHKKALMILLLQSAELNTRNNKDNERALEQLSRAKMLSDEMGDQVYGPDIEKLKNAVLRK